MRIIAGYLGGRVIASPKRVSTHPMSEKIRGALFSALGDLEGLSVLDAYSGSGAIAIEAISRGADIVLAIESDKLAAKTISTSLASLQITNKIKVINASIDSWLRTTNDRFDVIIADPPYQKLNLKIIELLESRLNNDSLLVLSWPGAVSLPEFKNAMLIKRLDYKDSQLGFYKT